MYSDILGTRMTLRLQRRLLPQLVWNQEIYAHRILDHQKPGLRWLDLGCGTRLLCNGLEKLESDLSRLSFVGLDPNWENLRSQRNTNRCVRGDAHKLPFASESFDLITANMVFEHLQQPAIVFQELDRVLAPAGTILLHTPNLANYLVFGNRVVSKILPRRVHAALVGTSEKRTADEIYPVFYRANTRASLRKLVPGALDVDVTFLPSPRPFFHKFVPLALVELLMTRLTQFPPFRGFGTTLLVIIHKAAHMADRSTMVSAVQ